MSGAALISLDHLRELTAPATWNLGLADREAGCVRAVARDERGTWSATVETLPPVITRVRGRAPADLWYVCGCREAATRVCRHVVALVAEVHRYDPSSAAPPAPAAGGRQDDDVPVYVGMSGADLEAWAAPRGMLPHLDRSLRETKVPGAGTAGWDLQRRTLRELVTRPGKAQPAVGIARQVCEWLRTEAQRVLSARTAFEGRLAAIPPADPSVAPIVAAITALARALPPGDLSAPAVEAPAITLADNPLRLVASFRQCGSCGRHGAGARAELIVEPAPALHLACVHQAWGKPPDCPLRPAALVGILSALSIEPPPPPMALFRRALATPPWRRALERVKTVAEQPGELALILHVEPHLSLSVARVNVKKRGDGVTIKRVATCPPDATAEESLWFTLMDPDARTDEPSAVGLLVSRAASTGRLYVEGAQEPAEVMEENVVLTAHPAAAFGLPGGGLTLGYAFAGFAHPVEDLVEVLDLGAIHLVEHDPVTGHVLVGEIPAEVRRVARSLKGQPRLVVPREAGAELVRHLVGLDVPLALPEELEGKSVASLREPVVRASWEKRVLTVALGIHHHADYPVLPPGSGPERLFVTQGDGIGHIERDFELEREQAGAVAAALELDVDALVDGVDLPLATAAPVLAALKSEAAAGRLRVQWTTKTPKVAVIQPDQLEIEVSTGRDWFGLSGRAVTGGSTVPLGLLLRAIRERTQFVELGEDDFVVLDSRVREALAPTAALAEEKGSRRGAGEWRVSRLGAAALAPLAESGLDIRAPAAWTGLQDRVRAAQDHVAAIPGGLRADLRHYQVDGFRWLARLACWSPGALLCDDMGLGKTVQAIALLLSRQHTGPALVVAPTSVGFNWTRELERFAPELKVTPFRGGSPKAALAGLGDAGVLVTSYDLLVGYSDDLCGRAWGTVVFDEAQAIKNPATQRAKAACAVEAGFRLGLSGTPIENRAEELWSLMNATVPGLLGSLESFRERFGAAIERNRGAEAGRLLSRVVRPFILRRLKREVARELPARTEITLEVDLSPTELRIYEQIRRSALEALAKKSGPPAQRRFQVLAALTRMRQAACHPRLVDPTATGGSAKLGRLLELLDELAAEGHRALVFSQFTSLLALVRQALEERGHSYRYLDGGTPAAQRKAEVDAFQAGEGLAFLLSLKAGGTGLNLTAADYVIHLDPWWNPAVEDQATDRAHRIGQTRPVTVYRLVAKGTLEQGILSLHGDKRQLVASVLDGADSPAALSTDELLALIEAGVTGELPPDDPPAESGSPPPRKGGVSLRADAGAGTGLPAEPRAVEAGTAPPQPESSAPARKAGRSKGPTGATAVRVPTPASAAQAPSPVAAVPAVAAIADLDALVAGVIDGIRAEGAAGSLAVKSAAWYERVARKLGEYLRQKGTALEAAAIQSAGAAYVEDVAAGRYPGAATDRLVASAVTTRLARAASPPRAKPR